jgi:hypothetical protein
MKTDTVVTILTMAATAAIALTQIGCAGMEVGGKLGMYRVDERQESQRTYDRKVGLRCLFTDCNKENTEAQGS